MFKNIDFIENVDLSKYSTMKTGGTGKIMVFPKNYLELRKIFKIIKRKKMKYFILGNGSNVLFDDNGFSGIVISMKNFNQFDVFGEKIIVGSGTNLFVLNKNLEKLGLSGLEWSYGIPASIGGLVVMNGGCFGHEICEFIEEIVVFDEKTMKLCCIQRKDIDFSYRYSNIKNVVVLNVKLKLTFKSQDEIQKEMEYYLNKKRTSQPCEYPSLGSIFKLIFAEETIYPAKLIDNLGLKGVKIGGAEISSKHAGFIVNIGDATSNDVLRLIELVENKLLEVCIRPEREIIYLKEG